MSLGFPGGPTVKNAGDTSFIPGSGISPREGNDNRLLYSCLRDPMDRGTWQALVHGVAKESDRSVEGLARWLKPQSMQPLLER